MTLMMMVILYSLFGSTLAATNKMKIRIRASTVEKLGTITNASYERWER